MFLAVGTERRQQRLPVPGLLDVGKTGGSEPMSERLEIVGPVVFVPLTEHVVDDVHASRQIVGKRVGHGESPMSLGRSRAVGLKEPAGVGHDDPEHSTGGESAAAVFEKRRYFFAGFEVFDEMLDPDAGRAAVTDRDRSAGVASDHAVVGVVDVEVDESLDDEATARDVDEHVAPLPEPGETPAPPRQEHVARVGEAGSDVAAKLVEEEPGHRQARKQNVPDPLFGGQPGPAGSGWPHRRFGHVASHGRTVGDRRWPLERSCGFGARDRSKGEGPEQELARRRVPEQRLNQIAMAVEANRLPDDRHDPVGPREVEQLVDVVVAQPGHDRS